MLAMIRTAKTFAIHDSKSATAVMLAMIRTVKTSAVHDSKSAT